MIKILNNPDINWNAISAITNIFVVIATFITLIVTIWLSIRNTTPKGKIAIGISDKAYIHFINTGVVNITLLGMYISLKRKDSINSVLGQRIEKTLYPSENFEFGIPHNRLSALLIEKNIR
ncbi:hypothetical protein [Peribacillus sp. TH14]|uniref:hypothetical protein n=1 Tax=Peribacillus sp. TH14 TaxID=2798481 RepID=UPI001913FC1D|nr:hypothetical protein [Peribacillus sp. TH14]MBK5497426.1 hypothetical protein [Peribacillus sp. TH14]